MLDVLIEAIIAGRLSHRQTRVALAVATGGQMGARRLEAVTGIDRADCRRALKELEGLGWLARDGEGGRPLEGGVSPSQGGKTPHGGEAEHPTGGRTPPAAKPAPDVSSSGRGVNHPPRNSSGGAYSETTTTTTAAEQTALVFPRSFTPDQQTAARRMLIPLNGHAQDLLDEVAGREAINPIKNPLAYLRGLVQRARAGDFNPEAGVSVAEARRRTQAMQRARKETEDAHLAEIQANTMRSTPPGGSLKAALEAYKRGQPSA